MLEEQGYDAIDIVYDYLPNRACARAQGAASFTSSERCRLCWTRQLVAAASRRGREPESGAVERHSPGAICAAARRQSRAVPALTRPNPGRTRAYGDRQLLRLAPAP